MFDGDIVESFVEEETKVNIEETSINLDCVKKETLDSEEDCSAKQYRITLEHENVFGESSSTRKFEEDSDNLVGFLDNDVIMENIMIKLEDIKEEDSSFNSLHCSKCKENYNGFCFKCSTLSRILNNNASVIKSEWSTIPSDILEIRDTSAGKGAFLLRTLPINVIFGPFEGILGIESTNGHCWKIKDNKLMNIKNGNWMINIVCAASASFKNLDILQIDGNLYFRTNKEIAEGEELLIYYNDEELQPLKNNGELLYTPLKQEKLPEIFACTLCCLGFGSNKCLMEHKRKCPWMEHSRSMKVFELIECHHCKIWMEKWEHEEYHVAYCLQKHDRRWSGYSEALDRSDANVEEIEDDCCTKDHQRTYQRDICSRPYDYQCFSDANHDQHLNKYPLAEGTNNEHIQNTIERKHKCSECFYQTNYKTNFEHHLNRHRGIKPFMCDICMVKFTEKSTLKRHMKNKHADNETGKDYECLECSFQTNNKHSFSVHTNKHRGIKQFQCDICSIQFTEKCSLTRHIKNMHTKNEDGKDYKCSECSYQSNSKNYFELHVNKHRGIIKQFECEVCVLKFTTKGNLKLHIKDKHTDDGSGKDYKCSQCAHQTNCKASFQKHMNKHRGIQPFECHICKVKFTQRGSLSMHMKNKHTKNENGKDYKCSECNYQTNKKHSLQLHENKHRGSIKRFQCDICMMKFTAKGSVKIHMKNKHRDDVNTKAYKCAECAHQTNYKSDFQKHLNKHRGINIQLFQCDICMMRFTTKGYLKVHTKNKHRIDESSKDYKCTECPFETNYKHCFQNHINKHRGIIKDLFQCDICMLKFTRKGSLNRHTKQKYTDNDISKDYKCSECPYQSNHKLNFQLHVNYHKGILRHFQCEICEMKFTQKSNLNAHRRKKHRSDESSKDYKCSECVYQTNYKHNFQSHVNKHRGIIKQFQCDFCEMKFTQKHYLKMHMKTKHTGN